MYASVHIASYRMRGYMIVAEHAIMLKLQNTINTFHDSVEQKELVPFKKKKHLSNCKTSSKEHIPCAHTALLL